jgi:hypothetical protein
MDGFILRTVKRSTCLNETGPFKGLLSFCRHFGYASVIAESGHGGVSGWEEGLPADMYSSLAPQAA